MRRRLGIGLGTIALAALGAGTGCAGDLEGDEASYRAAREPGCNVIPIFSQRCGSSLCHGGSSPPEGLDLASVGVRSRLLGVNAKGMGCESRILVDPTNVSKSYLLEKIESMAPQCGGHMPLVGQLTSAELQCIRTWATALAGGPSGGDSGPPRQNDAGGGAPEASTTDADSGGAP